MSDLANSTLSSSPSELDQLLARGLPALDGATEADLRETAHGYATALAYTWLNKDLAAQDAFLDMIFDDSNFTMPGSGIGVTLVVEELSNARLFGVPAGMARDDARVSLRCEMPEEITALMVRFDECVELITDLWTGFATGNHARSSDARARLFELPEPQARDVLRLMALDLAQAIEFHAIMQATGADAWEDYRNAHPPCDGPPPPAMSATTA